MKKTSALLWFVIVLLLLMLFAGINRGFDFTDEGFYMLKLRQADPAEKDVITFQYAFRFLFGFTDVNIINARIIRLALTLASSVLLAFAVSALIKNEYPVTGKQTLMIVFPFLMLGAVVSYSIGPQSIGYNSLSGCLTVIMTALVVFLHLALKRGRAGMYILPALTGFMLFLVLLSRVPSGLLMGVALLLYMAFLREPAGRKALLVLSLLAGVVLGAAAYSAAGNDIVSGIRNFSAAKAIMQTHGSVYSWQALMSTLGRAAILAVIIILCAAAVAFLSQRSVKTAKKILERPWLLFLLSVAAAAAYYPFTSRNFLFFPVALMILFALVRREELLLAKGYLAGKQNLLLLCLLLLLTPFIAMAGTAGSLMNYTAFTVSLWMALMLILMASDEEVAAGRAAVTLFSAMAVVFIVSGFLIHPHRTDRLWRQSVSIRELTGEDIFVDRRTYDYLSDVREALDDAGFQAGDTVTGVSGLPGLIYLMGAYSPGGAYWGGEPGTALYLSNLSSLDGSTRRAEFLLVRSNDPEGLADNELLRMITGDENYGEHYTFMKPAIVIPGDYCELLLLKRAGTE